jgi:hypothetical protein
MNQEYILKLEKSIENLRDKNSRIYFLVQDTKNNPKASVSYIYKMAYTLLKNGFNCAEQSSNINKSRGLKFK